jgi:hypothetical protein
MDFDLNLAIRKGVELAVSELDTSGFGDFPRQLRV